MLAVVVASWLLLLERGSGQAVAGFPAAGPQAAAPVAPPGPAPTGGVPQTGKDAEAAADLGRVVHVEPPGEEDEPVIRSGLTGRVVDPSGRPLGGARVLACGAGRLRNLPLDAQAFDEPRFAGGRRETESGADGRFELTDLKAGDQRLAVRAPGYGPLDVEGLELPLGGTHDAGDLQLSLGVVLGGRVVDADGAGVAGARLLHQSSPDAQLLFLPATNRGVPAATCAADGGFRIDVLDPGPWRLLVLSEDHPDLVAEGRAPDAGREYGGLLFRLAPAWSLDGQVVAAEELDLSTLAVRASPLGVQRLDLGGGPREWREARCDAAGAFRLRGLERGVGYRLRVREAGDEPWNVDWLSEAVEVSEGARGVVLEIGSRSSVRLTVLDAADGTPLEDVEVELAIHTGAHVRRESWSIPGSDAARRDARTGAIEIADLRRIAAGATVDLVVRRETYRTLERPGIALVPGGTADLGSFALERHPPLTVRVVDDESGQPLAGATAFLSAGGDVEALARATALAGGNVSIVDVESCDQSLETDAEGLVRFHKPAGRAGEVWATHSLHAPSDRLPVPAAAAPEQVFELRLGPGARVEVRVLDSGGRPAPELQVLRSPVGGDGHADSQPTDAEGRAVFAHVRPGRHRFEVQVPRPGPFVGFASGLEPPPDDASRAELTLRSRGTEELTLRVPARGPLDGRVTEAGRPLAGAKLYLGAPGQRNPLRGLGSLFGQPAQTTDADGAFDLGEHPAGSYELVLAHASRAMDEVVEVELPAGGRTLRVDLPLTVVEGRVADPAGRGLEGVELRVTRAGESPDPDANRVTFSMGDDQDDTFELDLGAGQQGGVLSGPDGLFRLRGVRAGVELTIHARSDGHLPGELGPLTLEPGELRTGADLELAPAGTVEVRARRADGTLLRVFVVVASELSGDAPRSREGRADHSGLARLPSLPPGRWSLSVRVGDEQQSPGREVEVRAGELTSLEIALP